MTRTTHHRAAEQRPRLTRPALAAGLIAANLVVFAFLDHFRDEFGGIIGFAMIACCAWMAAIALRNHRGGWLLLLAPIALAWNPFFELPLSTGEWVVAYAIAVAGLVSAAFLIRSPATTAQDPLTA